MCPYKPNPYHLIVVIHFYYKSVAISFNIKNNSIVSQKACSRIFLFNYFRVFPFRFARLLIPSLQLLFAIRMLFPKFPKYLFRNYPQLVRFVKGSKSSLFGIFTFYSAKQEVSKRMTHNVEYCCMWGIH